MNRSEFEKLMDKHNARESFNGDYYSVPCKTKEFTGLTGIEVGNGCKSVNLCFYFEDDEITVNIEEVFVALNGDVFEGRIFNIDSEVAVDFLEGNL